MRDEEFKSRILRSTILAGFAAAGLLVSPAMAQQPASVTSTDEETSEDEDRIVVTGSRVRRNSFTSTSPLQVIDEDTIQEAGLIDVGEILRSTSVVQGAQLDLQTNAQFVGNAGPGGQAVSLRGLAADRTLVLINGRRFAPAGVEGAPSFPDVSLIPSSMIQRVDILLDGASSVYGSDAVAGVTNIILRTEFEGLQVEAFTTIPEDSGGSQSSANFLVGGSEGRASFVFAAELVRNEELTGTQRDWMSRDGGQYCSFDIIDNGDGTTTETCGTGHAFQSGLGILLPSFALFYGAPGTSAADSDIGVAGFVNGRGPLAGGFSDQALNNSRVVNTYESPEFERSVFFLSATYDLDDWLPGSNFFTETSFSNRQTFFNGGPAQFTVDFNADNPFNPFGARGSILLMAPWDNEASVELEQWRTYNGLQGDLGFMGAPSWDYEVFAGYTRSMGYSSRTVTLEENLNLSASATIDPTSGLPVCGVPTPDGFFQSRTPETCVPINFWSEGLYGADSAFDEGQAGIDWLRGQREITTFVDERILGGFVTGPLFELLDGEVSVVLGSEWREQSLDSRSGEVAERGLGLNFFKDRSSAGSVELFEVYGEVVAPIIQDRPFAREVTFEAAARLVDHEFYGQNSTWSARMRWVPVDFLTLRGTAGTSFRAPNLRELFLGGQSGFVGFVNDPCGVPATAVATDPVTNLPIYSPGPDSNGDGIGDLDGRPQIVLDNCTAEGVDPRNLGVTGTSGFEAFRSGNPGLDPETSEAISLGFVIEQPFTDAFDLTFGVNYFEIEVTDSILVPTAGQILGNCYRSGNFPNDPFCTRRVRDPNTQYLVEVDTTPFNVSSNTSEGLDYNIRFNKDFTAFGQSFTLTSDAALTQSTDITTTITLGGVTNVNESLNTLGNPEWRGTFTNRLFTSTDWGDLTFFHRARWIGEVNVTENPNFIGTGTSAQFDVPSAQYHDISVSLSQESWRVTMGIQNVANEDPPQIDEDLSAQGVGLGSLTSRNVPSGGGYDQIGRRFFINVSKRF
ncbi:TonB-dependent receptor [Maricaulis sp.]|uniref:TonB-dependent receptor domain-containing protein n=1 Tax=Maricaulis sp. TaxID=1486257 RepID=UPI0025B9F811|nr:TonB-dependent receptor [Maricaulis sp.]